MKNTTLILFLLLPIITLGQNINPENKQKGNFIKAEQALKKSKDLEALHYYNQVCFKNSKTTLELKAKEKIDSLLPIY